MTSAAARPVVVVGSGVVGLAVARSVLSSSYDALAGGMSTCLNMVRA